MKFKKIKFCFKTSDYELGDLSKHIYIIFDKSRGYYGAHFCTDSNKIEYGKVVCFNSGNEYDSYYTNRTVRRWCFWHKHPTWEKSVKPRILDFTKTVIRKPIDV